MQSLANKVALITGASSGIGRATAIEFAKYGAKLAINGRNVDRLKELQAKISTLTHTKFTH